jgi:hypothetical protein
MVQEFHLILEKSVAVAFYFLPGVASMKFEVFFSFLRRHWNGTIFAHYLLHYDLEELV